MITERTVVMAALCHRRWPLFVTSEPASFTNFAPLLHLARVSSLRRGSSGVSKGRIVQCSELQHSSIYEDGYVVLQNFFTQTELQGIGASDIVQSSLLKEQRGQLLRNLVGDIVRVERETSRVQEPGFKCTDGATSPEPWWDSTWEVAKLDIDEQQRLKSGFKTACLILSCSDRTTKSYGGRFCVFPRSHWLVADWSWASSGRVSNSSLSNAFDVPAAAVIGLELGRGDAVLLHPFLAWSLAPNSSTSSTTFLFLNLYNRGPTDERLSGSKVAQMWHGWTALTSQLTKGLTAFQAEEVELMLEEVKAIKGGWAIGSHEGNMPELPFSCSYVAPRDHLSWQLRLLVNEFIQKEMWEEGMMMLQQLAGLRPQSYWVAYHAGQCCILSAPCGQLAGRAGRKSRLEDAERFLLRAIEMAPGWPLAYAELAQALLLLGRGREKEIPEIIQTMKRSCSMEQLCERYPEVSGNLKQCFKRCEIFYQYPIDNEPNI